MMASVAAPAETIGCEIHYVGHNWGKQSESIPAEILKENVFFMKKTFEWIGAFVISTKIDLDTDVTSELREVCVLQKGTKVNEKDEFFRRVHCLFSDILLSLFLYHSELDLEGKFTVLIELNNKITVKIDRAASVIRQGHGHKLYPHACPSKYVVKRRLIHFLQVWKKIANGGFLSLFQSDQKKPQITYTLRR